MSEQKTKSIKLIDRIYEFEEKVAKKEFSECFPLLQKIFVSLENGKETFGKNLVVLSNKSEIEATAFASAFTQMIINPDFVLKRNMFELLAKFKRVISQTFEISGYRGTKHLIRLLSYKREDGTIGLKGADVPKLFCGLSINAMNTDLAKLLLRQKPDISWPLARAFLTEQIVYTAEAEQVRSLLLSSGDTWKDMVPSDDIVQNVGPIYMGCSYADAGHKHDIKKTINRMVRDWLLAKGVTDAALPEKRKAVKRKPTLIIMAELYTSIHAMHRCYGPAIRSLKERFKLIYMSAEGKCDPALEYMFDKVDTSKLDTNNPKEFFDKAKSYRPDVIYYPSIGMRLLSIMGSNIRLAPVQVMTYGHPGTAHSNYIDYSLIVDGLVGNEDTVGDKILYWYERARYEHRPDATKLTANIAENPNVITIAVPAWSRKITPKFIQTCREIEKRASKPVQFVFFPNGVGALFLACKRRIESLCTAKVLPRTNYNDYTNELSKCDIFLSTFPFGATNGILDAGPLGLPIVNMKGPEVHAMNDSEMVSHMPQPDWLSTNSQEEYIEAVLRLIDKDEERVAISHANAAFDFDGVMMVDAKENCASVGVAVEAAYRKHETLQEADAKSFSTGELAAYLQ